MKVVERGERGDVATSPHPPLSQQPRLSNGFQGPPALGGSQGQSPGLPYLIPTPSGTCMRPGFALVRLTLTEFRNYAALTWRPAGAMAVLYGPNGSGKTNLLEAMSLLVPAAACAARGWPIWRAGAGRLGGGRAVRDAAGRVGYRHRHAAGRAGGPAGVPARRRRAAQPGRNRRAGRRGVADAADGPAVPGGRFRPPPFPGPPGVCAGAGPCARGRGARYRHGAAQPPAGRGPRGRRPGWPGWRTRWRAMPWPRRRRGRRWSGG